MFGSEALEVAIGLSLLFLFVSLICTAAREALEAKLKTRAMDLERGLREMLDDPDGTTYAKALFDHPMIYALFGGQYDPSGLRKIRSLTGATETLIMSRVKRNNLPSYADCNERGLDAMVFEAYRSQELQAIYYQRGRTVIPPPKPVTNAPTNLQSWHGYGLAVDVVHKKLFWDPPGGNAWFKSVSESFKKFGCSWGGDWTQQDTPHFQWGRCKPSPSKEAQKLIKDEGVEAVWKAVGAD